MDPSWHRRVPVEEYIFYPAPKITVALLRGSLADEAGNISFERVAWWSMCWLPDHWEIMGKCWDTIIWHEI